MRFPQNPYTANAAIARIASWIITVVPYVWMGAMITHVGYQQHTLPSNLPSTPPSAQPIMVTTPRLWGPQTQAQRTLFTVPTRSYHNTPEAPRAESTLVWQLLHYPENSLWAERMVATGAGVNTPIEELEGVDCLPEELQFLRRRSLLQFVLSLGYYNVARYLLNIPTQDEPIARMFPHFPSREFVVTGLGRTLNPTPANDPWHTGRWADVFPITLALNPHSVPELNDDGQRTGQFIRPQDLNPDQRRDLLAQRNAFLRDWINDERFTEAIALRQDAHGNTILHYVLTAYMPPVEIAAQLIKWFPSLRSIANNNGLTPWMWAATRGVNFQFERLPERVLPPEEELEVTRKEK